MEKKLDIFFIENSQYFIAPAHKFSSHFRRSPKNVVSQKWVI